MILADILKAMLEKSKDNKAIDQRWINENDELKETTAYALTKLRVAWFDVVIEFSNSLLKC